MPIIKFKPKQIHFTKAIQKLCLRKGGSFPKGCPNYNKKQGCPPQPLINEVFDLKKPMYLIYTNFSIKKVANRMQRKHPEWSEKMCYNPRYWQQTARKQHKLELEKFLQKYPDMIINRCPEAHGVNVHKLMSDIAKITLEWPPKNLTRIVSVGGYAK